MAIVPFTGRAISSPSSTLRATNRLRYRSGDAIPDRAGSWLILSGPDERHVVAVLVAENDPPASLRATIYRAMRGAAIPLAATAILATPARVVDRVVTMTGVAEAFPYAVLSPTPRPVAPEPPPTYLGFSGTAIDDEPPASLRIVGQLAMRGTAVPDAEATLLAALPRPDVPEVGVVPGTINLIRNPSAERDLTDWSSALALLDRDETDAIAGSASVSATLGPGASAYEVGIDSLRFVLAEAATWAGSIYVFAPEPVDVAALLRFTYLDGGEADQDALVWPLAEGWSRIWTMTQAHDPERILLQIRLVAALPQHISELRTFLLDAAQIEEAVTGGPTPYADGDQGENHRWLGAEHNSPSEREPVIAT